MPCRGRVVSRGIRFRSTSILYLLSFYSPKSQEGICLEYHQYWPSAAAMTRHKKCFGKFREIKAIGDTSPESSENELAMSGQNTLSDKETEFLGKENENDPMPIFNIFELLKSIDFLN